MANKKLASYIHAQINKGFDAQTIKNYLLRHGYGAKDVDDAFSQIYSSEVRHVIHFSPTTLVGTAVIFISIVSIVSFFYFNSPKAPEQLLDLNLEAVQTTANAGSTVAFISEIDNLGSAKRYDVAVRYELINLGSSEVLTFKEETRAIETKGSKQITMDIPSGAAPGSYILRSIALYDDQRAVATLPVTIRVGDAIPTEIVQQVPEELERPAEEEPEQHKDEEEAKETSESATSALTTYETLEEVEKIAPIDSKKAESMCRGLQLQTSRDLCFNKIGEVLGDVSYCQQINDERTTDVCLSNVAKINKDSSICEMINKDSRKDSCYMNFVIDDKDYSVCGKVTNQYLQQSCESLRQLSKLNITDVAFYESLINQSLIELV
jgi:hypothetical protein